MKPYVVLAAVDFSTATETAVERALDLAGEAPRSVVHLLTVQELGAEILPVAHDELRSPLVPLRELAERAAEHYSKAHPSSSIERVVVHTTVGDAAREIVTLAAELDADAIVMGTHGRRGVRHAVLGSVAEKVVRTAGCTVLVVRPKSHPEALKVPEIEPLCPECAKVRASSGGREFWCARHSEHHVHAHAFGYEGASTSGARPWGFAQ